MRKFAILAVILAVTGSGQAIARKHAAKSNPDAAQVTERDSHGRPSKVRIDGQEYPVCTPEKSDGCINPRQAGLDFGNAPSDTKRAQTTGKRH